MSGGTELQRLCWRQYEKALRKGALIRSSCAHCSAEKAQGHHADYTKPLDVVWLCRSCHSKEHVRLGWGYQKPPRGKGGPRNKKRSEESRVKQAESLKQYWATVDRSQRKTVLGQKRSHETCDKHRQAQLGRKASPETIAKLRASHLGKIPWNKGLRKCT